MTTALTTAPHDPVARARIEQCQRHAEHILADDRGHPR